MTFRELIETVLAIQTHGLTETNVESIDHAPDGVWFTFEESDTEAELAELAECKEDLEAAQEEIERLTSLLADIKTGDRPVLTLIKEAEQAKELAKNWREHAERCEKEVTALRKRKGMDAAYMKYRHDIMQLLGYLDYEREPRAVALLAKMREGSK